MHRAPARFDRLPAGPHSARVMLSGYEPVDVNFEHLGRGRRARPPRVTLAALPRQRRQIASRADGRDFRTARTATTDEKRTHARPRSPICRPDEYQLVVRARWARSSATPSRSSAARRRRRARRVCLRQDRRHQPAAGRGDRDRRQAGRDRAARTGARGGRASARGEIPAMAGAAAHRQAARRDAAGGVGLRIHRRQREDHQRAGRRLRFREAIGAGPRRRCCSKNSNPATCVTSCGWPAIKPLVTTGTVRPGEQTFLGARFVQRPGPQRGAAVGESASA